MSIDGLDVHHAPPVVLAAVLGDGFKKWRADVSTSRSAEDSLMST